MQPNILHTPETHNAIYPHRERHIAKTIFLLNINTEGKPEGFQPRVRELTMPLLHNYARKIGAAIVEITARKFPEFPITYEKFQIHDLAKDVPHVKWHQVAEHKWEPQVIGRGPTEWAIYIDVDALVSPEFFDITMQLPRDHVCHNGRDMANMRWQYDQYFMRDGRNWGSCNWFTVGSDWMLDAWRPLDDISLRDALRRINITIEEYNSGECRTEHLIDDYTLSRNIARFGLKATTLIEICERIGYRGPNGVGGHNPFLWHIYTKPEEEKLRRMLNVLSAPKGAIIMHPQNPQVPEDVGWGIMDTNNAMQLREKFGLIRRMVPANSPYVSMPAEPFVPPAPGEQQSAEPSKDLDAIDQVLKEGHVVQTLPAGTEQMGS